jgi:hypothetical protein
VDGYLAGKRVNKTLGLRDWTRANSIIRDWEIAGSIQQEAHVGMPVCEACYAFMTDAEAQRLSESSLKKYRVLLINQHGPEERKKFSPSLLQFCAEAGSQFTTQITLPELTHFRAQWKDGPISGGKKLERLRAVGRFFVDRGWWSENLALKLKRPKFRDVPTTGTDKSEEPRNAWRKPVDPKVTRCDKLLGCGPLRSWGRPGFRAAACQAKALGLRSRVDTPEFAVGP